MRSEEFTLHFLLHSANIVGERLCLRLADIGLSQIQARIIDALDRMGPVSQVALVREFGVTPTSMSTMMARLIEAGYITRRVDPAQTRSNIIELTPIGRALVRDVHQAWRDANQLIADTMGAEDAAQLAALTQRLRDRLGGQSPGSARKDAPTEQTNAHEGATT